jgi:hypothetical protein
MDDYNSLEGLSMTEAQDIIDELRKLGVSEDKLQKMIDLYVKNLIKAITQKTSLCPSENV